MLNVDEVYWQSTIDAFLPHMILQKAADRFRLGARRRSTTARMDRNVLAKQAARCQANGEHQHDGVPAHARGSQPALGHAGLVQQRTADQSGASHDLCGRGRGRADKRLDIVYWWLFNYNQGKTVAGTSWGNHVSDWEHVKVKLDQVDFANPQNEVGGRRDVRSPRRPGQFQARRRKHRVLRPPGAGASRQRRSRGLRESRRLRPAAGHARLLQGERLPVRPARRERSRSTCGTAPAFLRRRLGRLRTSRTRHGSLIAAVGETTSARDLLGLVARLESGPEGPFRPGEYAPPLPLSLSLAPAARGDDAHRDGPPASLLTAPNASRLALMPQSLRRLPGDAEGPAPNWVRFAKLSRHPSGE